METAGIVDAQHKGGEPLVFGITELADNTALQLAELVGTVLVVLFKLRRILFEDNLEGRVTPGRFGRAGGIIGVIIGCGASWIVKSVAHWPIFIQPWSVFLSFAVCTVTGVFFGWYPAKKAADLDPIEAIRYE